MNKLKDKVAIVTGGAMGIGKATAIRFAAEGAKVVIWDINEEKGKALADELDGLFFKVNTTDLSACESAAKAAVDAYGQIDVLINNAGITRDATMKKMTADQWQQVIDVNLTGVFNSTKAILPYMLEREYGRIISAASVVAHNGNFGQTNYVATKAGVIGMTKVWAKEFGRKGITANAVAPGFIGTEMVLTIPEKVINMLKEKTPVPRLGEPSEIAAAYAFLASDDAAFINGAVLNVDGGATL
ncbi:MAG: beta-ketoacyl-ACP reductase [Phaeodactylibacter sp.]|uniref:beta-ketoacyl-ACP reductase n=1 Tax=Phaeodactylibacter sp. TaxID=1940289 RepID=UPI0032EED1CB